MREKCAGEQYLPNRHHIAYPSLLTLRSLGLFHPKRIIDSSYARGTYAEHINKYLERGFTFSALFEECELDQA